VSAPQESVASRFKAEGLPVFQTEADAIAALNQFVSHLELITNVQKSASVHTHAKRAQTEAERMLNEADSLILLQRYGVPVIAHQLCRTVDEAARARTAFGAPVALKGCSADIVHKTELGLVQLNLRTEEEVRASFDRMRAAIERQQARFDGVIVAQMASGRRELMIGARIDPVFGPVVVLGDGGKYVEALPDVQLLLPPFTMREVKRALARLRIAPLLKGVRGEPPLDVDAFSSAVEAVGRLMLDASAGVANLDLNPVIVGSTGEGCRAVDAVVYVSR
jgi:acetate---CoA ligase (ADP-forming)